MRNEIAISSSHEFVKSIRRGVYTKQGYYVIDDLGILMQKCMERVGIEYVCYCPELVTEPKTITFLDKLCSMAERVYSASKKVFLSMAEKDNAQGIIVVAKCEPLDIKNFKAKHDSLILVCDGIEIAGNMGTLFRSADAVGCDAILCTNVVTKPNNPKVIHSSRGMVLKIPHTILAPKDAVEFLKDNEYKIYTCETLDGISYDEAEYGGRVAIIVGSERYGITKELIDSSDQNIYIPMVGDMTSLNVGVAGSIILYEALSKRQQKSTHK